MIALGVPKNPGNPFFDVPAAWNKDGENWVDYDVVTFLKTLSDGYFVR
jgi:hypothetical protein